MAIDGTVLDVPDSKANARVFGYPASRRGTRAAFPKVRVVMLIEAGTHLIVDALMCPYRIGERVRAKKLLRSVSEGMLLMWDRGLHSYAMVQATLATRCDYLGRVPANAKFSVENVQEIYGWLLGHYTVRHLMFTAATQAGISPLRLGFTGTLKVLRRAIAEFQDIQSEQLPFFSPS
jgi:hypothetical protein